MRSNRRLSPFDYVCAFAIASICVLYFGCLYQIPLRIPLYFTTDTLLHYMFIQPSLEGESPSHITRLGAPFFHNAYLFPQQSGIDYALASAMARLTGSTGGGLNVTWVVNTGLTALFATWCFRLLGVTRIVAVAAGILYSQLPYTYVRNVWHINLSFYLVPAVATFVLLVLEGRWTSLPRRVRGVLFALCFLAGINGPYNAFFGCLLMAIAVIIVALTGKRERIYTLLTGLAVIVAGGLINGAPSIVAFQSNPMSARDYVNDREKLTPVPIYSLKIADLLLPTDFHPLWSGLRRQVTNRNAIAGLAYLEHAPLGAFGAIGFLLLLASLARSTMPLLPGNSHLRVPAVLVIFLLLIASAYGFSSIIATFLIGSIRSYDRMITFIAFLCFLATCRGLDRVGAWWCRPGRPWRARLWQSAVALLIPLGVLDQHGDGPLYILPTSVSKVDLASGVKLTRPVYEEAESLIARIESELPKGTMIYQMGQPYGYTFDSLIPYAVGKNIRWSYAPLYPTDELHEWRNWFEEKNDEDPVWLLLAGFDGILFDRKEREKEWLDAHIARATALPAARQFASNRNRYLFVDLSETRRKLIEAMGEDRYTTAQHAVLRREDPAARQSATAFLGAQFAPVRREAPHKADIGGPPSAG